jgi:hypothetical protein
MLEAEHLTEHEDRPLLRRSTRPDGTSKSSALLSLGHRSGSPGSPGSAGSPGWPVSSLIKLPS